MSATLVLSCQHEVWNPEQTSGDTPEESEDDVKSSCPLYPGRHTCYNGWDEGSQSREGELTPKIRPRFGLSAATRLHEAGIASNRSRALYTPPVTLWELAMPEVVTLKEGDAEGRASDWSEVVTRCRTERCGWITSFSGRANAC
ncbi:uncharacterized protein LOC107643668 [Arachis ipaensis]|uniref:uncharacterized protein LOC107643668 n=1 Tax=Arachis ipaensis TaxID=130454 RepID=UPI0007AF873E|nr:uncharacterized protein LOC107643668 [Arachis ipaensis]XP_025654715.1 uncharacterized protein LOC112750283 [Arachis hypogaea]